MRVCPVWAGAAITVSEGNRTYSATAHRVRGFDYGPMDRLPSPLLMVALQTVRSMSTALQNHTGKYNVAIEYANQRIQTKLSPMDWDLLQNPQMGEHWLVPDIQPRQASAAHRYSGHLTLAKLKGVRFYCSYHDRDLDPGRVEILVSLEDGREFWMAAREAIGPIGQVFERIHPSPFLFAQVGDDWDESEPVELVELRKKTAVVVHRRQLLEAGIKGGRVELFEMPKDRLLTLKPGFWWMRPSQNLSWDRIGTQYLAAQDEESLLTTLRNQHLGVPMVPPNSCEQALLYVRKTALNSLNSVLNWLRSL
ncbi:hypothetical protein K2X33_07590 [bacterium]|nr:hypothetical protein [bacterium]